MSPWYILPLFLIWQFLLELYTYTWLFVAGSHLLTIICKSAEDNSQQNNIVSLFRFYLSNNISRCGSINSFRSMLAFPGLLGSPLVFGTVRVAQSFFIVFFVVFRFISWRCQDVFNVWMCKNLWYILLLFHISLDKLFFCWFLHVVVLLCIPLVGL